MKRGKNCETVSKTVSLPQWRHHCAGNLLATHAWIIAIQSFPCVSAVSVSVCNYRLKTGAATDPTAPRRKSQRRQQDHVLTPSVCVTSLIPSSLHADVQGTEHGLASVLTFRHRASCILGQAFHYSPENAFYIFNQQIYFIIWYLLDRASLIEII